MTVNELRAALAELPGDMPVFSNDSTAWPRPVLLVGSAPMYRSSGYEGMGGGYAGSGYRRLRSTYPTDDEPIFQAVLLGCHAHEVDDKSL